MAATPEPPPRIPPLPMKEWSRDAVAATAPMTPPPGSVYARRREERGGSGGVNALAVMVRHPALTKAFLEFNSHLLYHANLDERIRELVVLRISWTLRSAYEWAQHVPVARECGVTDDEIVRIREDADAPGWSRFDAAVVRATDSLLAEGQIDDDTWATLAEVLDEAALLDFVFTVGAYTTLGMVFNAVRLPLDPDLEGFPDDNR